MCALLFSFDFLGANLSPSPLRATARALRAPFLPTEPALFPIFSRVRFWESASQASVERERRAKSWEVSEEQFVPLSCRRKKRFRRKKKRRRRRQQTKKLNLISPLLLQTKLHSALGDIGNLVAPLARVNVSQAEKARAQEVRKGSSERGEKKPREKHSCFARCVAFFLSSSPKRARESGKGDGSLARRLVKEKGAAARRRLALPSFPSPTGSEDLSARSWGGGRRRRGAESKGEEHGKALPLSI